MSSFFVPHFGQYTMLCFVSFEQHSMAFADKVFGRGLEFAWLAEECLWLCEVVVGIF